MALFFSSRKSFASLLVPSTTIGSIIIAFKRTSCDAGTKDDNTVDNSHLSEKRGLTIKKRMTHIGRFSLKSETASNPSVPTFFMALSGKGNYSSSSPNGTRQSNRQSGLTRAEFKSAWLNRAMPDIHPRFHRVVSKHDDRYFESKSIDLSRHIDETAHTHLYRGDLKKRIETLLMTPINVFEKLWEVQISSGPLGSSGAIDRERVKEIVKNYHCDESKLIESLLLFRCHHSLGDAVSMTAAFGDLLDEAEEIRDMIKKEIGKRRVKSKERWMLVKLFMFFQKLVWILLGSVRAVLYQSYLMLTTRNNPFLEVMNLKSSRGLEIARSASWCGFASIDEVKLVAKTIGPKVTINDVFVSCVTAAVARQLAEHREKILLPGVETALLPTNMQKSMNVVIPAHLAGGIIPPDREVGNMIGAFVARVPGEMNANSSASDRLYQVHSNLYKVKRSPASIVSYYMARMSSSWLPNKWTSRLLVSGNANAAVVVTNSRGLNKKVHINGRTVESLVGFIPLPPNIPVGVVVSSYDSVVTLSVSAEKWAVPDSDKFLGWILEEYKQLCREAKIRQDQKDSPLHDK